MIDGLRMVDLQVVAGELAIACVMQLLVVNVEDVRCLEAVDLIMRQVVIVLDAIAVSICDVALDEDIRRRHVLDSRELQGRDSSKNRDY